MLVAAVRVANPGAGRPLATFPLDSGLDLPSGVRSPESAV